jgi:hypothetical protein
MSYHFGFLGWCRSNGHDKIWGWVENEDSGPNAVVVNFWGGRGNSLTFKRYTGASARNKLETLTRRKEHRAIDPYVVTTVTDLEKVTPGFLEDFERQLFTAKMFHKFHLEG